MFCGCKAVSLAAFVAALLSAGPAFTQTPSDEATPEAKAAAPVAYVYVTRPTHIDSFTAASDGKLSAVSGSPIQGSVTGLSVNEQYLFGINSTLTDNQINSYINAYKIASDGAIALSAQKMCIRDRESIKITMSSANRAYCTWLYLPRRVVAIALSSILSTSVR